MQDAKEDDGETARGNSRIKGRNWQMVWVK